MTEQPPGPPLDFGLGELRAHAKALEELLTEAAAEYLTHQSWRCSYPDRYPWDPDCPCGLTEFVRRARAAGIVAADDYPVAE